MNFIPYGKQTIDDDDIEAVINALKSNYLTTGPKVEEFEQKICQFTGVKYAVATSNCTTALHIASICLLNKGDKVLTTPNSFLATSNAILYVEAIPVFVDIDSEGNIDLDLCEEYLKKDSSIKAIYGVHFSGKILNQDKLLYLKETYNIKILEDCAHSIGAEFVAKDGTNIKAGSCYASECSVFSFHPVKQLTTGEGGAVTTNDENIYKKLLLLRSHGMTRNETDFINTSMAFDANGNPNLWYYEMQELGNNYRLTDIQCALGISQFNKLDGFIAKRKEIAKLYDKAFENNKYIKPLYTFTNESSYHLYVLQIEFEKLGITRNNFMKKLLKANIGTQVHYIPINKQPYYQKLGYGKEYTPKMDKYYKSCLSIPIFPMLEKDKQNYVIDKIKNLIRGI